MRRNWLKIMSIFVLLVFLVSCGGGGGGSSTPSTGGNTTTQALSLDNTNYDKIASFVASNLIIGHSLAPTGNNLNMLNILTKTNQIGKSITLPANYCTNGGEAVVNSTFDGTIMEFKSCKIGDTILDGKIESPRDIGSNYTTFKYNNFKIKDNLSETTLSLVITTNLNELEFIYDGRIENIAGNSKFIIAYENLKYLNTSNTLKINGKLYTESCGMKGWVEIKTIDNIINGLGGCPTSGKLEISSGNSKVVTEFQSGCKVKVTFNNSSKELDYVFLRFSCK